MYRTKVVLANGSSALILPPEALDQLGLKVGDEVEVSAEEHRLIVRSVNEAERRRKGDALMSEIMERRRDVFERLARIEAEEREQQSEDSIERA
jgi:antitoxin component of MazEF toxin-antitoxin module